MSAKKKAKDKPTEEKILTEVPPVENETVSETAELLVEVPPIEEVGETLVEEAPPAVVETAEPVEISNHFTGDFAPAPNPRKPRGTVREKSTDPAIDVNSLTLKQKRALLGGFSKKTLAGRFGIKF